MKIKINDLIFWVWMASGFSFVIAMSVPKQYWFIIWFGALTIPLIIFELIILSNAIHKSRKKKK